MIFVRDGLGAARHDLIERDDLDEVEILAVRVAIDGLTSGGRAGGETINLLVVAYNL